MKITKEIKEIHIAYFVGYIKIKYRGKRINEKIVSKRDFYNINIYSTEIKDISQVSEIDYNSLKQDCISIDLNDVLIEKPDNKKELFQEDLKQIKIFDYDNHSFNKDNINYGIIKGKVIFKIPFVVTKTIFVEKREEQSKLSSIFSFNENLNNNERTTKPNFSKTNSSSIKSPPQEPYSFLGCLLNLIGIIVGLILIFSVLFLLIKIWKAALIFGLILGVLLLLSYFGHYILKALAYLFIGAVALIIPSVIFVAFSNDNIRPKPIIEDTDYIVEDNTDIREETVDTTISDSTITDTLLQKTEYKTKTLAWRDYKGKYHSFEYKVNKSYLNNATNNRKNYVSYDNNWSEIYYNLYSNDYQHLKDFIKKYDKLKDSLSRKEFAELIVSSIQYQPYVWILDVGCNHQRYKYEIAKSGCSCLGYITRYAVQSPYEYISNQKGDCDTRSLILYIILKHYKYDVVLLTSNYYEHAIIGINLPSYGKYKNYRGKKYYVWETTAKNMRIGQLNASVSNMNLWNVTL